MIKAVVGRPKRAEHMVTQHFSCARVHILSAKQLKKYVQKY